MRGNKTGERFFGFNDLGTPGRYEVLKKLGQGGSGTVYLARDLFIRRNVAVKVSQPVSDGARERFLMEAQSAGRLQHPNIVAIYDAGVCRDFCYITMEYVDGPSLDRSCRKDNLLPLVKVLETVINVCNALDYAHKNGVIHRDMKPSNILIGEDDITKITDFSAAQMTEQTAPMGFFGTPSYMAPEQLKDEMVSPQSDIFSIGCVLYGLLVGERAFSGDNAFSIMYKTINAEPRPILGLRPDLPKILDEIMKKAIAKDPKNRYQACTEFAYDLNVALRGLTGAVKDKKLEDVMDVVHHLPFFRNFSKDQVRELVAASQLLKVRKDKVIMAEGEIDDTFYIIISGRVKVRKDGKDIASIGPGNCFGEMAYIGSQPRVANVLAESDCILMKINAALLDSAPESIQLLFFRNFATTLVQRLSQEQS
jgi:serine/threonine-protein kinase